jgi:hypothetical protein
MQFSSVTLSNTEPVSSTLAEETAEFIKCAM